MKVRAAAPAEGAACVRAAAYVRAPDRRGGELGTQAPWDPKLPTARAYVHYVHDVHYVHFSASVCN